VEVPEELIKLIVEEVVDCQLVCQQAFLQILQIWQEEWTQQCFKV